MDIFRAHLHGSVGCTGGLCCTYDRPRVNGSRGARDFRRTVLLSRRAARRTLRHGFLRDLARGNV